MPTGFEFWILSLLPLFVNSAAGLMKPSRKNIQMTAIRARRLLVKQRVRLRGQPADALLLHEAKRVTPVYLMRLSDA